ncbi:MAG: hypothetical protein D4R97_08730 [Bacteroidetes bacterium]|nr:MAG: hypothetical protein D4R97_08730 [Bacteroidota bacterium]
MEKIKVKVFTALMFFLIFSGCQKDSSPAPSTDARVAFLGNWGVQETWVKLSYEVTITADTNSKTGVLIHNFAMIGFSYPPAKALVSGNTITLDPNQVIGNGLVVNGSGSLSGTTVIHWSYTISDGATQRDVSSTYTRR